MRALVVDRPGRPEMLTPTDMPDLPLGAGEVRVDVEAAGLNPVDADNRSDPGWACIEAPYVVGYEFAGVVAETSDRSTGFAAGDAVWGLLPVRGTRWGAYAEQVVLDAALVGHRPTCLSAVEAAGLPLAGATALQLLDRLAPDPGDWLLVHGAAGGVGHLLVQLAHASGSRIAAPVSQARTSFLQRLGVEVIVDRHGPHPLHAARDAAGTPFAAVADLVGNELLAASLEHLAVGGQAGTVVEFAGDLDEAIDRNVTLHGVLVQPGRNVLDRLAALVENAALRAHVDRVIGLEEVVAAHHRLESRSGQGKLVLVPNRA